MTMQDLNQVLAIMKANYSYAFLTAGKYAAALRTACS